MPLIIIIITTTVHSRVRADIKCADRLRCRPVVRPRTTAGLWIPVPAVWSTIVAPPPFPPLRCVSSPRFDTWATAPETRPLPAVKRAYPSDARNEDQFLSHESACLAHKRSSNLIRIFTNEGWSWEINEFNIPSACWHLVVCVIHSCACWCV